MIILKTEEDLLFYKSKPKQNRVKYKFKCSICGKISHKNLQCIKYPFICHKCSLSIAHKTEEYKKNYRDALIRNHGDEHYNNHEQAMETYIKNHGGIGFASKTVTKKIIKTMKKKHNIKYALQSEEFVNKAKATRKDKYGDENYNNHEQACKTYKENTGYDYPAANPKVIKQIKETKKKLHSDENWNNREKAEQTCMDKWGVRHQMQVPSIAKKTRKKNFVYDGIRFDSNFEIKFYKFLKDNNIEFEYQPELNLPYTLYEEQHTYNPDFKIGEQIIELKGLQFFENKDTNKRMINPYRNKKDTPEIIQYRNDLMEAKHQCMIKNGVKIITKESEFEEFL
jgi:hypothetical protein